ncbi:MAG: hypothetical protein KDA24_07110 [Deltaproteobacteria bacterium]|nr:hypothetical protein [Deltaproteobacteria bacterium]
MTEQKTRRKKQRGAPAEKAKCPCVYCYLESYNVIEVRFARTLKSASVNSSNLSEETAPREIVGRGYYVCDGCLAVLDYHEEHHLDPGRHGFFNILSGAYMLFLIWLMVAVWWVASGNFDRLLDPRTIGMGGVLAIVALGVWLLRATVHFRYLRQWREARGKPMFPRNTLGAFTSLRDKRSPELGAYLPVRFDDSLRLAGLPGSPPIRAIGPGGEPWGQGAETNFAGRGDNDMYRLVWISWRLWPLTRVVVPEGVEWDEPPQPSVQELEVAAASFAGVGLTTFFVLALGLHPLVSVGVGIAVGVGAFFGGRTARLRLEERRAEKYGGPAV